MTPVARNAKDGRRAQSAELSGSWAALRDRLAEALGVLEEGQYLILSGARSPYYVQFAMEADSLLWAEAVSDAFLPKGRKLGKAKRDALVGLGWRAPAGESRGKRRSRRSSGSPNFQGRFEGKGEFGPAATIAVRTLRDVYGFGKTGSLRYRAFDREGGDILLPTLGIGRSPKPAEEIAADLPASLGEQVLDVVSEGLGVEGARFDSKGFLTLEADGEPVFVLLLGDPPCVRLFTPVLLGVANEGEALGLLNTLNFEGRLARFVLDEGTIFAVIDLPGAPFVPEHFVEGFMAMASAVHELPGSLRKALGGRPPSDPKAARVGPGRKRRTPKQ